MTVEPAHARQHRMDSRHVLNVIYGLHSIGEQPAYFTVTGEVVRSLPGGRHRVENYGTLHEDILGAFPDLQPLVDLHLSTEDGVPMHAVANGWYWAGGTEWNGKGTTPPPDAGILASHLRVPEPDAESIIEAVTSGAMDHDRFTALVDALRPSWKAQADRAHAFLETGIWTDPSPEEEPPSLEEFLTPSGPRP